MYDPRLIFARRLWKIANGHSDQGAMVRFLANDFSQERWKSAALKNAYVLLSKQRFEYAVAFFILADCIGDAVDICIKKLNDFQLALVLCRLYIGENSELMQKVLAESIVPECIRTGDRWLLSMAFTLLKDKKNALYATVRPLKSFELENGSAADDVLMDPSLALLFEHLTNYYRKIRMTEAVVSLEDQISLINRCSFAYDRMGYPAMALRVLSLSPYGCSTIIVKESEPSSAKVVKETQPSSAANVMDWGEPVSSQPTANGMDWGEPVSSQPASNGMDWGEPVSTQPAPNGMDWGEPVSTQPASNGMDWDQPSAAVADLGEYRSSILDDLDTSNELQSKAQNELIPEPGTFYVTKEVLDRIEKQQRGLSLFKRHLTTKLIQV